MMHQFKVVYRSNNEVHDFIMNGQATLNKEDGEVLEAALIDVAQYLSASAKDLHILSVERLQHL
ncbi:hypothetical protein [Hafnia alvei]|uniref:Uncharacterized protein n=1 Tax=Hafnia alvei TaxID=569 RepID=A0A1C6YWF8_HAFAL|nr:hypothetical protein [Hafnia alvei]NLS56015.1 hypothetical protein [Hafnia alvei]SCM51207.1 hypothetical protein BN1044_00662 [Hafnia alvei]